MELNIHFKDKLVMTSDISAPDIFKALKDKDLVPLIAVMTNAELDNLPSSPINIEEDLWLIS